jgi:hypothetical protein
LKKKVFFFEKKKQKTFAIGFRRVVSTMGPLSGLKNRMRCHRNVIKPQYSFPLAPLGSGPN